MNHPEYDWDFAAGVLTGEREGAGTPPQELWERKKAGLVIIECPQRIPCNPCHTSCPTGAILPFADINDVPSVNYEKCTGCALCVAVCPGLACFVADLTYSADLALMKLPYEFLPRPTPGSTVALLNRVGERLGQGKVVRVVEPHKDKTLVVHVEVSKQMVNDVRAVRVEVLS